MAHAPARKAPNIAEQATVAEAVFDSRRPADALTRKPAKGSSGMSDEHGFYHRSDR